MSTQIVKIEGDIAYLYDDQLLRVFKIVVEDRTGLSAAQGRTIAPASRSIPEQTLEGGATLDAPPAPVIRKRKSIMPPELRSVMLPPGTQGSATETRMV
jgi:hypothetical protein